MLIGFVHPDIMGEGFSVRTNGSGPLKMTPKKYHRDTIKIRIVWIRIAFDKTEGTSHLEPQVEKPQVEKPNCTMPAACIQTLTDTQNIIPR